MKHFLIKENISFKGSGGGKPQAPQPPIVSQYPSVLTPPQYGAFNSINSFSYAEMIDLISDGPIEGLVNKNGRKVYEENIFEGIYLNDTPVKETSSIENQYIPITFLKNGLKRLWQLPTEGSTQFQQLVLSAKNKNDIDDANFSTDITLTYFRPTESIPKFVSEVGGDISSFLLINRAFELSPFKSEKPFLTVINIPKFTAQLDRTKFDDTEGGETVSAPIKLNILNISEYLYFSVGYDSLNSFNYFELPKSFVYNDIQFKSGKTSVQKIRKDNDFYYEYDFVDIKIYIWSVYDLILDKPKNFDTVLDKYFSNLIAYQNKKSLYNYNLVNSEFRNGSQIQTPLNGFLKTEMDIEIGKELVGEFRLTNSFTPAAALDAGGVQRITDFNLTSNRSPFTNIDINAETSDDIRYIKNWPVEYDSAGKPYIIQGARANYAQFDKSSSCRPSSEAIPITHYIANQNVEEVYVTLNLTQLSDTNHIDLVGSNSSIISKKGTNTDTAPAGTPTYSQLPGVSSTASSQRRKKWFLMYGSSVSDAVILAGTTQSSMGELFDVISCFVCNKRQGTVAPDTTTNFNFTEPINVTEQTANTNVFKCSNYRICDDVDYTSPYFCYIRCDAVANDPLRYWAYSEAVSPSASCVNTLNCWNLNKIPTKKIFYVDDSLCQRYLNNQLTSVDIQNCNNSENIFTDLYMGPKSPLKNYLLPVNNRYLIPSICTRSYINNVTAFESVLKKKDNSQNPIYYFGLDDNEKLATDSYFDTFTFPTFTYNSTATTTDNYKIMQFASGRNTSLCFAGGGSFRPSQGSPTYTDTTVNIANLFLGFKFCTILKYLNCDNKNYGGKFFVASVDYFTAKESDRTLKAMVGLAVTDYIPFDDIFNNWSETAMNPTVTLKIDKFKYPNIVKYIVNPYLANAIRNDNGTLKLRTTTGGISCLGNIILLGINLDYLISNASFWKSIVNPYIKILTLDSLEFLLFNYAHVFDTTEVVNYSSSSIIITNPFQESLKKIADGKLIGSSNIYSISLQKSAHVNFYDRTTLYANSKTLINVFTDANKNVFDKNYVYLLDPGKTSVSRWSTNDAASDYVIFYSLVSNQIVTNYTNPLATSVKYGLASDGVIDLNNGAAKNIPNVQQQISAGAKLPAVVSVKVETGYEGQEQQQKFNTDEYFAYQYDMFGIASEQTLIDIGRNSAEYIYSKRINSESGAFFQKTKQEYFKDKKVYLYKITLKRNGITNNYYLLDSEIRKIGDLLVGTKASATQTFAAISSTASPRYLDISILTSGSTQIGLKQTVVFSDTAATDDPLAYKNQNDSYFAVRKDFFDTHILDWSSLNLTRDFLLTDSQVNLFFSDSLKQLNLNQALPFLKTVKNNKTLFSPASYPTDSYSRSSPLSANTNGYDRYEIFLDANNFMQIDLYTYSYNSFNIIDVSSGLPISAGSTSSVEDLSFQKRPLYLNIYRERPHNLFNFVEFATKAFPQDLFFYIYQDASINIIGRFTPNKESQSSTILDLLNVALPPNAVGGTTQTSVLNSTLTSISNSLK